MLARRLQSCPRVCLYFAHYFAHYDYYTTLLHSSRNSPARCCKAPRKGHPSPPKPPIGRTSSVLANTHPRHWTFQAIAMPFLGFKPPLVRTVLFRHQFICPRRARSIQLKRRRPKNIRFAIFFHLFPSSSSSPQSQPSSHHCFGLLTPTLAEVRVILPLGYLSTQGDPGWITRTGETVELLNC